MALFLYRAPSSLARIAVALLLASPGCGGEPPDLPDRGDPERGRLATERAGCGSCHRIPGIDSARGEVGPPLNKLAVRAYLGGVLPNNFDNLVLWLAEPQTVSPETAMPNVGLSDEEAEDIAAYLYTLK